MSDTLLLEKTSFKEKLVPVIFANGEDDDTNGIVAAVCDKVVFFDDDLYQPGEAICITGRKLFTASGIKFIDGNGYFVLIPGLPGEEPIEVLMKTESRKLTIQKCNFV